jgi:hypothetical protein
MWTKQEYSRSRSRRQAERCIPPKLRTQIHLNDVTAQNTTFFVVSAVRILNPTLILFGTFYVLCIREHRELRIPCFVEGRVEIIQKSLARLFELGRELRKQVKWVLRVGDEVYEDKSCH